MCVCLSAWNNSAVTERIFRYVISDYLSKICQENLTSVKIWQELWVLYIIKTAIHFYIHVTVHRNKFLFNKTNRRTNFPNLFVKKLYIFRPVHLHIIRNFPLYNRQCRLYSGKLPETCRVSWPNKFGKLVRLLVLLKRNLLRCTVTWT